MRLPRHRAAQVSEHTTTLVAAPGASRSLRTRWIRAFAIFLVVFTTGGIANFAGTRVAVAAFRGAAVRMERDADALARLRADIVSTVLFRSAAVQSLAVDREQLRAATEKEAGSFAATIRTLRPGGGREIIERQFALSNALWAADIAKLTPADFVAKVAQGRENFAMLDQAGDASRALAHEDLSKAAALERNITVATALAGLLLAALVIRFARRLSTEVLRPVAKLRDSADRLAAGDLDHRVEVDRPDEIGDLAATFNTMADVIATSHRNLTVLANQDALTGVANRAAFHARLDAALAGPDRRDGTQAVLFVDLDDFKDVNDELGHAAGDAVLCAVAARLTEAVRPGDLVARVGGDEFALLLDGVPEPAVAVDIAERAVEALGVPVDVAGTLVRVGASAGLAIRREDSDTDSLMRDADMAMYSAKDHGKNRVERYEAAPRADIVGQCSAATNSGTATRITRRRPSVVRLT